LRKSAQLTSLKRAFRRADNPVEGRSAAASVGAHNSIGDQRSEAICLGPRPECLS